MSGASESFDGMLCCCYFGVGLGDGEGGGRAGLGWTVLGIVYYVW